MALEGSHSDTSDPTFLPSSSPPTPNDPRAETSSQAQQRALARNISKISARSSPYKGPPLQDTPGLSQEDLDQDAPNNDSSQSIFPSARQIQTHWEHNPALTTSSPSLLPISVMPEQKVQKRKPLSQNSGPSNTSSALPELDNVPKERAGGLIAQNIPLGIMSISDSKDLQTYLTRPNRYFGPASTWRSWTEVERTVAASLDRARAQDLSIHLYNAYILRRKAELAGWDGRRDRSRSRSRTQSMSRSRSRGRHNAKGKDKEIIRAENSDIDLGETSDREQPDREPFAPPRLWTAWPMPPDEVPREDFLSPTLLNGIRRKGDVRPSAELEECLIAVATKFAKEKWETRDWQSTSEDEDEKSSRASKRRKKAHHRQSDNIKAEGSIDVQMQDQRNTDLGRSEGEADDLVTEALNSISTTSTDDENDVPLFSSQMFTAQASSSESTVLTDETYEALDATPVFSADDEQIRHLLLRPTRNILSQLDDLLGALHKMQTNQRRKTVAIGGQGHEQVLGMAALFFSPEVVARARRRCTRLFDDTALRAVDGDG